MSTHRVVAVQPRLAVGEVEANLRHLEDLVRQAHREHAPAMIFLPEAMTSPNLYHRSLRRVARPIVDGAPTLMLRRLARELDCFVGGGFIAVRGADTRGTYLLAEPDGAMHLHDKDQPSFWENNYYTGGNDDGLADTSLGPIGLANGFEWGRTRTVTRLRGRAHLLAGGMHFPSFPTWKLTRPWFWDRDHRAMIQYARETVPRMARLLGVPAIQPSHVCDYVMDTPLAPGVRWPSICIGETQICDARGVTLGRMAYEDGEGWIAADVEMTEPQPMDPVPDGFWNSLLPISVHIVWQVGNVHGRAKYAAMKRLGMHEWQAGEDLPDHVPAPGPPM